MVCSKWRSILLNTSALWTTIVFGTDSEAPEQVICYLDRCGKQPLCVEFDSPLFDRFMDDLEENTSTESYQEAITRLLMTLPQWQHVHLYLDLGELPVFEDLLIGAFQVDVHVDGNRRLAPVPCPDVLESVTLAISDAPYEDNPVMLPDAFQSAPNLTSFTLLKPHLDPDPSFASIWPTCGLPWTQIREITLDYNDLDILRDIPEEVYTDGKPLTLTISSKSPEWETDEVGSPTLVFDKITALHLHPESWTNDLPEFLHDISMPALQDLTLSCLLMSDAHDWRRNQSGAYRIYADIHGVQIEMCAQGVHIQNFG